MDDIQRAFAVLNSWAERSTAETTERWDRTSALKTLYEEIVNLQDRLSALESD